MPDPNRFSVPVIEWLTQLMQEQFPSLSSSRGGPFYQTFILPASVAIQPLRDRMNTMKRNLSPLNYQVMSNDEMDKHASRFLVDRNTGTRAYGIQRVFFDELRAVSVEESAVFIDDQDRRWRPIAPVSMTAIELSSNVILETGEYYVDVSVVAEAEGEEYRAAAGQVNRVANVPGAIRTTNPSDFFSGRNIETNTELYARLRKSINNKDLVKPDPILAAIQEAFPSVRDGKVIGFLHPDMARDTVEALVSIDQILRYSFCQKVNLPLDENGDVKWTDEDGNPIISPVGGYVAAIVDLTGVDFNNVVLASDSINSVRVSVQPGYRVRMYAGYTGDPDEGDYTVTRVEEVPVVLNGNPVKVTRLDRPFSDPQISTWNPVTDFDKYSYTIFGGASTRTFHVGGKVDVFVDSTADEEDYVIVSYLPQTAIGVSEVPITDLNPTNQDTSNPLFENGKVFRLPVLNILRVEQVDFEDDLKVERELIPSVHYNLVLAQSRGRFTREDNDVLIIKGFEEDGETPAFIGTRIKIVYTTNPDIPLIQEFVDSPSARDVTKDILVKPKKTAILDTELSYRGPLTEDQVREIVGEYIRSKGFGAIVTTHDITTLLAVFGVDKVSHPITLRLRRDLGNGVTETELSEDELTALDTEVFYPASPLSVVRL